MTNKIQDAFESIRADSQLKESTKQYLGKKYKEYLYKEKNESFPKRRHFSIRHAAAFSCALLAIFAGITGYTWARTPVAYVSIDVNPSIELALNRFDRVVSVTAYNTEGEDILNGLSLNGKKYTEALNLVLSCEDMRTYLTDRAEVVLTVAADQGRERELEQGVKHCAGRMGQGCRNARANVEMVSEAHACGLSLGKYNAYQELLKYDSTVTADDCKEMSMAQIREKIREYKKAENSENAVQDVPDMYDGGDSGHAGHGNCGENCGGSAQGHGRRRRQGWGADEGSESQE